MALKQNLGLTPFSRFTTEAKFSSDIRIMFFVETEELQGKRTRRWILLTFATSKLSIIYFHYLIAQKDGKGGDDDADNFSGEADTSALLYNMVCADKSM